MADVGVVGAGPSVLVTERKRINWLLGGVMALACVAVVIWSIRSGTWDAVVVLGAIVGSGRLGRWWWTRGFAPGVVPGALIVPRRPWWQDRRCTMRFEAERIRIQRLTKPEAWEVPWTELDELAVSQGRSSTLTLMLDGTPLAAVETSLNSDKLVSLLNAIGLQSPD